MKAPRLLALALVVAAPSRAEIQVRLSPSLRAGVLVGSDLFLLAGVGPGIEIDMAPSLVADVSLAPRLKLKGEYDFAYAYTQVNGGSSYDHLGTLNLRTRVWGHWWLEVVGTASAQRFTVVGTATEGPPGREITSYDLLSVSPRLRYLGDHVDAFVAYVLASTASQDFIEVVPAPNCFPVPPPSFQGQVDELAHRGVVSVAWSPVEPFAAALQYRFTANDAHAADADGATAAAVAGLVYTSHEGSLVTSLDVGPARIRLEAAMQRTLFAVARIDPNSCAPFARRDTLLRGTVGVSFGVRPGVALEIAYGYARNFSTEPAWNADLHTGYAGIRLEVEPWRY